MIHSLYLTITAFEELWTSSKIITLRQINICVKIARKKDLILENNLLIVESHVSEIPVRSYTKIWEGAMGGLIV